MIFKSQATGETHLSPELAHISCSHPSLKRVLGLTPYGSYILECCEGSCCCQISMAVQDAGSVKPAPDGQVP